MAAQKFFFLNCGFLTGILLAGFLDFAYKIFYFVALAVFIAGVIFFRRHLNLISLFFIGLFIAVLYFGIRSDFALSGYPKEGMGNFKIMSTSETLTTDKSQRFYGKFLDKYRGEVLVFYSGDNEYSYGQILSVSGEFKASERKGSLPVVFADEDLVQGEGGSMILKGLFNFKSRLVDVLTNKLSSNAGALASGLILGEKTTFSAEFREAMRKSGTTHIVALSGFNISILVGALGFLVSGFRRKTRIFLYSSAILIFTLMVGADPSIVRAAIMGYIFLLSKEFGRDITAGYSLSFAGAMMLAWNPLNIYSVGFQLSFLSFSGIAYLAPIFSDILKVKEGLVSKVAIETMSAQIVVLPLIVNYFGGFSPMSFLANVLILGTVPMAMFFVFILLVINFVFPFLTFFIVWICEIILGYQIAMINLFSKLYIPAGDSFKNVTFTAIYTFLLLGFIILYKDKVPNEGR